MKNIKNFMRALMFLIFFIASFCFYFLSLPLAGAALNPQAQQPQQIVIQGGTLIDGTAKEPIKDAVIIIEGNKIKTVSTKGKASYPKDTEIIDATGKTIIPGLMDLHVHLGTRPDKSLSADDFTRERLE